MNSAHASSPSSVPAPDVSLIICHHQGTALLLNCLDSVAQTDGVTYEVLVATSAPRVIHERAHVRWLTIPGGPAHKRNVAFRFARGRWIAFFDDDVTVEPDTVAHLVQYLAQHPHVGMVFGKLRNMVWRDRLDEAGSYLTWLGFLWARAESGVRDRGQYDQPIPILAGKSAACAIRRQAFIDAGFFDASYEILGEETDVAWRCWLMGWDVHYVPQSVTYHAFNTPLKPATMYTHRRIYYNGCRNYLSLLTTNLGHTHRWIIPLHASCWLLAAGGMVLVGKWSAAWWILRGLVAAGRHWRVLCRKRQAIQARRTRTDAQLFPLILRQPPLRYYLWRLLTYWRVGLHGGGYQGRPTPAAATRH